MGVFAVTYTRIEAQCADIFTRMFSTTVQLLDAIGLIGVRRPGLVLNLPPETGPRPPKTEEEEGPKPQPKLDKARMQALARRAGAPAPVEQTLE